MTDDDKALVERLREGVLYGDARLHNPKGHDPLRMEAADRIEALSAEVEKFSGLARLAILKAYDTDKALSAENERLREALMLCAKHVDWMPHPHCVEVEAAIRAALGDTK